MAKNLMAFISAAIFVLLVSLAVRAWKTRITNQKSQFEEPLEALEYFGSTLVAAKGFYVATTFANNVLERIAAYGLGARGNAQVLVFSEGLLIVRNGERPLAIDRFAIQAVSLGQVAIDKAVENNGLIQVNWIQSGIGLATHIRIVEPSDRQNIYSAILSITTKEEAK